MKRTFSLLLVLTTMTCVAQDYDALIKQANAQYKEASYEESANTFDKAFDLQEGTSGQYYNAACSWALTGDTIQSIRYLHLSAEAGWINLAHVKRDSDLNNLHETTAWRGAIDAFAASKARYEASLNQPLLNQLHAIYLRDQTLRQVYLEAQNKFGRDSEEMDYFWSLVQREDSANQAEIRDVLDAHGWPGTSEVGGRANAAVFLVIQHAPHEMQEHYLPMLQESVAKGESSGNHLAMLEDRVLIGNDQPQKYGSQYRFNEETGQQELYPVMEPENINKRRRAVGLGPIEAQLKSKGIIWDVEQRE